MCSAFPEWLNLTAIWIFIDPNFVFIVCADRPEDSEIECISGVFARAFVIQAKSPYILDLPKMVTAHSARYVSYLEKQRLKIKQVTFLLRDALIFITLNCFCHFNRKPAPHPDLHFHGCCSTGCIVFDFSLLEIGLMSLLYLTPLAWVCFPVGKCMPTCLSAVGKSVA